MPAVPQHRRVLGDAIRDFRKKAGVSQERLAEKADLDPTYVSEIECGKANASIDVLHRIATALGRQLRDFFH